MRGGSALMATTRLCTDGSDRRARHSLTMSAEGGCRAPGVRLSGRAEELAANSKSGASRITTVLPMCTLEASVEALAADIFDTRAS